MKNQASLITLIASIAASTVIADDKASFSGQLEAGALSDSQLYIDELQQSESSGDNAILYKAGAKLIFTPTSQFKLNLGTGYSDKSYLEQSQFDLSLLQANIDASYKFDWFTLGASHHYIDAKLDGEDFMQLNQTSYYLSRLFASRYFIRANLTDQQKEFADNIERNADNQNYGLDLFVFFNRANTFINLGFNQDKETADSDHLSYAGQGLHAKFGHTFYGLGKKQQLQLGWQQQQRDYDAPYPEQELVRDDDRNSSEVSYQFHFSDAWSMQAKYEVFDYRSNIESAVYDGDKTSLMVRVEF